MVADYCGRPMALDPALEERVWAIVSQLQAMCRDGDTVVFMGAGPVNQIGFDLLKTSRA